MIHVVAPGETLSGIASRYGISINLLAADNLLSQPEQLVPGQTLIIHFPLRTYTVLPGDTLESIGRQTGVSVTRILQLNPALGGRNDIFPGQTLVLEIRRDFRGRMAAGGYIYPFIREEVLRRTLPYLTTVSLFSYGFQSDGSLVEPDDERVLSVIGEYDAVPVLLISSIGPDGRFSNEKANALFSSPQLWDTLFGNLIEVMKRKGYRGLELDFEYIPAALRDSYTAFARRAAEYMAANGFFLAVDLAPKTYADQPGLLYEGIDYRSLGEIADYLLLMTYEWGYKYGPPLAVSPLPNVERVVRYGVSAISAEKLNLGMPGYGYDWPLPFVQGQTVAETIFPRQAVEIARGNGAEILYDNNAQAPYFTYYAGGIEHIVWFQDARSVQAMLDLRRTFGLNGASWWTVMDDMPQAWGILAEQYDIIKF